MKHVAWMVTRGLGVPVMVLSLSAAAAVFTVNPAHPRASDRGEGSAAQPLATLKEAMSRFQPGDTLRIAPGLYREPLVIPQARQWAGAPDSLIEGLGDDAESWPELRGSSVVKEWQRDELVRGLHSVPLATQPQQVFVEGAQLKQAGGTIFGGYPEKHDHALASLHRDNGGIWPGRLAPPRNPQALGPDSFFFDTTSRRLWVQCGCDDLNLRVVEVSDQPHLVMGRDIEGVTVRRLRIRHANSATLGRGEAVTLIGRRLRIEQLDVQHVDAGGIGVKGEDIVVERSRVGFAGQIGMNVRGRRIHILHNHLHDNNTRGFNKWWEAGGAKMVGGGPYDSEFAGNLVERNRGDGIWFDHGPTNNRIHGNLVRLNAGFGIHYEASYEGRITGNVVVLNGQRGIYLPHSSGSLVMGNLVAMNGLEGITVVDEGRRHPRGDLDFEPKANNVCGNLVAWNKGGAIVLPSRVLDNRSDRNTVAGRGNEVLFSLGWWPDRLRPVNLRLQEWQATTGQDRQSAAIGTSAPFEAEVLLRALPAGAVPGAVAPQLALPASALIEDCAAIAAAPR